MFKKNSCRIRRKRKSGGTGILKKENAIKKDTHVHFKIQHDDKPLYFESQESELDPPTIFKRIKDFVKAALVV